MSKEINAYLGNAYVRYLFFSWCENMTFNNACNIDKETLFFIIYDLQFYEFVMLKKTLN